MTEQKEEYAPLKVKSTAAMKFMQKERGLKRHVLKTEDGDLHFLEPVAGKADGITTAMGEVSQGRGSMQEMQVEAIRAAWVDEDDTLFLGADYKEKLLELPIGDFMRLFVAAMEVVDLEGEAGAAESG